MAAVAILAVAAAVVNWDAQYVMVARARHTPAIAALEAGIPDAGAAVFAALGIAQALHGRRALRSRALNPRLHRLMRGVGDVISTFRWNPLDGCEHPAVAIRRADAFANSVSEGGVEDSSFWAAKATDYLRAYFHAALGGPGPAPRRPLGSGSYEGEAETILATYPTAASHLADQLAEMHGEPTRLSPACA